MLAPYADLPEVVGAMDEAGAAVGADLSAIAASGQGLDETIHTQPAMVAAGVGIWRAWRKRGGPEPIIVAGHSIGEYAALVAAGCLNLAEAAKLACARAAAMQDAVPAGAGAMMAILGLASPTIAACCQQAGDVWLANLNAPMQTVISGRSPAVAAAATLCRERGAKRCLGLPVSVPSHCPLMAPAADRLTTILAGQDFAPPATAIIHNAGGPPAGNAAAIKDALSRQLCAQVDWINIVGTIAKQVDLIIECGPGQVLYNLNRKIVESKKCAKLDRAAAVIELAQALA